MKTVCKAGGGDALVPVGRRDTLVPPSVVLRWAARLPCANVQTEGGAPSPPVASYTARTHLAPPSPTDYLGEPCIASNVESWTFNVEHATHPQQTVRFNFFRAESDKNSVEGSMDKAYYACMNNDYHNRAIATQAVIEELIALAKEMSAATKRGEDLGLNEDEVAFYDALAANESAVKAMGNDELKVIAAELVTQVRKSVTIDWTLRESARAKIKVMVKRILKRHGYPPDLQEEDTKIVLAQAELLCANWVS